MLTGLATTHSSIWTRTVRECRDLTLGHIAFPSASVLKDETGSHDDWTKKICDHSKGLDGTISEVNFVPHMQIPIYEDVGEVIMLLDFAETLGHRSDFQRNLSA